MRTKTGYLYNFQIVRPSFEADQEKLLSWIIKAHLKAQEQINQDETETSKFSEILKQTLFQLGLGKEKITKRSSHLKDCTHDQWEEMEIYHLTEKPEGKPLDQRMEYYEKASCKIFEEFYPLEDSFPSHLIHVTCTGYVAPSPAQKLVSLRKKGKETIVTHAYHMGCYASIPSIRMAWGHFLRENKATDIVHTEFCSLHMNPTLHSVEQLIVQSLFADGFIKYTLGNNGIFPRLRVLCVLEEIIENSDSFMSWNCKSWGFQMTISKEVPFILRRHLEGYLERLLERAKRKNCEEACFAIHPGGPKIIDQVAKALQLKEEQIRHSREILQNFGNMSSATLPHVWESILKDPRIKPEQLIISLAFGPGLTISGGVFVKEG